jgi:leader peptidase (prepilin peptidase)/N-methyltransferase
MRSAIAARSGQLLVMFALFGAVLASLLVRSGIDGLLGAFLAASMITIALVDVRRYVIPNSLNAAAFALALLRGAMISSDVEGNPVASAIIRAVITVALFYMLSISYRHFRGREGFGFGDVKLMGVAAGWLDWPMLLVVIEGATLAALATYLLRQRIYKRPMKSTAILPFGTFLAPSIWLGWLMEVLLG